MPDTAPRDPLKNPRPRDSVRKVINGKEVKRTVEYVTRLGHVIYSSTSQPRDEHRCTLASWKKWCRGAEVVYSAEWVGPVLHRIQIPDCLDRELRMLRSRFFGAKVEEGQIAVGLMEMAVAVLEGAPRQSFTMCDLKAAVEAGKAES